MKRLPDDQPIFDASNEEWLQRREATLDAWAKEEAWWRSLGIAPRDILLRLRAAGRDRAAYEGRLRATQGRPPEFLTPEGKRVRRLLDGAGALIEFIKREEFFGNIGKEVDRMVKAYRERYLLDSPGPARPRLPRNRPGEIWLRQYVVSLARIFREKDQSWGRTRKAIYDALVLAGHGDVVTLDKIRNILREERVKDPGLGEPARAGRSKTRKVAKR